MTDLLNQGLLITVIGMGLVFFALIILWGFINLISRIPFKDDNGKDETSPPVEGTPAPPTTETPEEGNRQIRAKAAAVAVASALALQKSALRLAPPAGSAITAWQATRRAGQFSLNAQITTRKPRGSAR